MSDTTTRTERGIGGIRLTSPTIHARVGAALAGVAIALAVLGLFVFPHVAWAATHDAKAPSTGPDDRRIRTTMQLEASYELKTHLRYGAGRLDVVESVTIVNRAPHGVDALHLSVLARAYGEFRLRSVQVDGRATRVRWPGRSDMSIRLPDVLESGEQMMLVIRFSAHPSGDTTDSLRSRLSRAEGMMRLADWYPILSTAHGLRNPGDSQVSAAAKSITLDLTTDRALTVAAPGELIEHRGRRRVYRLDDARNHGFVVAPRLRSLSTTTRDGVRVRVYHGARVSHRSARRTLREARRALETFDRAYGPYPWPELIVAPTPGRGFATEWPSIVFLASDTYGNAEVVHHEVAHQWFYAVLGNDQLREPWVDEAFAVFSERHFFGSDDWSYCSRRKVDSAVYAFPDTYARWGCGGYVETVYEKGAAMIDGVRTRMGDRAFFAATRKLIADHRFELVTGEDVATAWMSASKRPQALESWLRRFLSQRSFA